MDSEFHRMARDIMEHPRFQQLRGFIHHGADNSVYDHSVAVAESAYAIARKMRLSEGETQSVVRAALLHDFFGYDWHSDRFRRYRGSFSGIQRLARMHAFVHGHIAAGRARRTFGLTDRECEAIARHMFPLAAMPRTRIAWIVTWADKVVASKEMTLALGGYMTSFYQKIFGALA
ncbi:HD domain-containing protein [Butyricicoccus sp. Marseille-Q5471]|uniref:HD domain-containing protein n=1 Tax=Butyricicoccus sp. Marseille-Q5471 TaxID=3039493 RepID=UPI0024BCC21C|nr:HD domain-containing protein [Butyricicoccus sp. Marseille-Q5471]